MQFLKKQALIRTNKYLCNFVIPFDEQFKTLRGGGCGSVKVVEHHQTSFPSLPNNLATKLQECTNILVEKASLLMDENQKEEIMIAIQWFYFNQQHFNTLCFQFPEAQRIYSLLLQCLDSLLKTAQIYLRGSGFLCIYILQICNDLMRIVFSFLTRDSQYQKRYLEDSYKQQLQKYIASFEDLLKNEVANVWDTGIEFEISMIRSALEHTPSNSTANQELFIQFMGGVISTICNLSPQQELLQALFDIGTQLITEFYNKYYKNELRRYKIYYFFETLKWAVVNQLRMQFSVKNILDQLIKGYEQYIQNSSDWQIHFCWIRMISDLATYRPIISKSENFKTEEESESWNTLIKNKEIIVLSYSSQHARILFKENQKQNFELKQNNFSFAGENYFKLFYQQLIGLETQQQNNIRLWKDYIMFSFKNLDKKFKEEISLNELLFGSREIEIFRVQTNYLEELIAQSAVCGEQIQKQFQNFSNEKNKTENIKKIYSDDIGSSIKQQKGKLIQIMQLVLLIKFTSNQFVKKCKLILDDQVFNNKEQNSQNDDAKIQQLQVQVRQLETKRKEQEDQLKKIINLYPQFIKTLTYLQSAKEGIETLHSDEELKKYPQLNTINYKDYFKKLELASQDFQKQILTLQQKNLTFFNQKKTKEAEYFSSIQFKSLVSFLSDEIVKQISQMIIDIGILFNFNLGDPNQSIKLINNNNQNSDQEQEIFLNCQIFINYCEIFPQILKIFQHLVKKNADGLKTLIQNSLIVFSSNFINSSLNYDNLLQIQEIIRKQKENLESFFQKNQNYPEQGIQEQIDQIKEDIVIIKLKQKLFNKDEQNYELQSEEVKLLLLEMQFETEKKRNELKDEIFQKYVEFEVKIQKSLKINSSSQNQCPSLQKTTSLQDALSQSTIQSFNNEDSKGYSEEFGVTIITPNFQELIKKPLQDLINITKNLAEIYLQKQNSQQKNDQRFQNLIEKSQKQFNIRYKNFQSELQKLEKIKFIEIQDQKNNKLQGNLLLSHIKQYFQILNTYDCEVSFQTQTEGQENIIQYIRNKLENNLDKEIEKQDSNDHDHNVKECLVFNLLKMQSIVPEQQIINFCQNLIWKIWGMESDGRVKKLLKNKEMIDLQKKMFSQDLQLVSDRLKSDINKKLDSLNELEFQIGQEGIQQKRNELQNKLDQKYQEFDKYLDGITDMASKLDLSLLFLKDIRKQLSQIKTKIDLIQNSVLDIGKDLRKLKGKNFTELLMMRRETVLEQQKQYDMRSVYIPLKVQEWDPKTGLKIPGQNKDGQKIEETALISDDLDDLEPEVNQFLYNNVDEKKDVMLIRGFAGSGKSRAAKKIEEFLWENYDKVEQKKKKKWTPIFVSLPAIREPRFNLFTQALESDFYRFDQTQIREFKTEIQKKKLNIVLILDSYDEMKSDIIQKNLYLTNSLNLEFFENDIKADSVKQFKIIITTRSEILLSKNYQTWFCGFDVSTMKEVEILQFNDTQNADYLNEFTNLNKKKFMLEMYEYFLQIQNLKFKQDEFQEIWERVNKVSQNTQLQTDDLLLLNEDQIENIIKEVQSIQLFKNATKDQLQNLTKELGALWSVKKFQNAIKNINISQLLTTPFMMEIVVQVLPNMIQDFSKASVIKEYFLKNYIQVKLTSLREKRRIDRYQNKATNKSNQRQDPTEKDLEEQAKNLWEALEKKNFLQNFSIDDDYKVESDTIISIANTKFEVGEEAKIIIRTLKQHQLTNYDFYYSFVQFYHQKQIEKQMQLGKAYNFESLQIDLIQYSQSLALEMTKNQLTQVNYRVKGQLNIKYLQNLENVSWEEMYFNDFQGNGDYKKIIRSCTLLNQKGNNFSFTHKSIQEFYVAKYFIEQLEQLVLVDDNKFKYFMSKIKNTNNNTNYSYNDLFSQFQKKNINLFTNDFTKQDFNFIWQQFFVTVKNGIWNKPEFNLSLEIFIGCLKLMRFKLKKINKLKPILLQQIYLSRFDEMLIQAASNSLFILTFMNEYFENDDLSQIKISNTKLNGASFFMTNLSGSKFNNVDVSSCNFNCANLNEVLWENFKLYDSQNFEGHQKKINDIKLIQQNFLISCSNDALIKIWNLKTSQIIQTLDYHTKEVTQLCIFNDEKQFASIGLDKKIFIYNIDCQNKKFEMENSFNCQDPLYSISYQQELKLFILGGKGRLWCLDLEKQQIRLIRQFQINKAIVSQCISPDQQILAVGNENQIQLFEFHTEFNREKEIQNHQLVLHSDNILALQFFVDSQKLVSGGADKIVYIYDIYEGIKVQTIKDNIAAINSISILTDCEQDKTTKIAYSDGKCIKIWDFQAGKIINKIEGHANNITTIIYTNYQKSEKLLIFGSDIAVMRSLSADNQEDSNNQEGHSQEVTSVSFSPDGLFVASGSYDKKIKIWETRTGKQVADLIQHKNKITQVLFSPTGDYLASISEGELIYVWDAKTYQFIKKIDRKLKMKSSKEGQQGEQQDTSPDNELSTIATFQKSNLKEPNQEFKHEFQITQLKQIEGIDDYKFVAGTLEGKVLLAKNDLTKLETLYQHQTAISALDYANGTKSVGSGSQDGQVFIYSLEKNQIIYKSGQYNLPVLSLAMFPDTSEYISGHQEGLVIKYNKDEYTKEWKLGEEEITSIKFIANNSQALVGSSDFSVYQINFKNSDTKVFKEEIQYQILQISTQSKYLATGKDSLINLWDLLNNRFKARWKAHFGSAVSSICFSDNEEIMASGGTDDLIHIWNLKTNDIKLMGTLYGHSSTITKVEFKLTDQNKQILISSSKDCSIRVWDIQEFEQIMILQYQDQQIISFEFFHKKLWLASASQDKSVAIINMENGKLLRFLNDNKDKKIQSLTISLNDNILAVSFEDSLIKFYNTKDWQIDYEEQISMLLKIQFSHFNNDILYLQKLNSFSEYTISKKKTIDLIKEFNSGNFSLCKKIDQMAYFNKKSLAIKNFSESSKDQYLLEAKESAITALAISEKEDYFSTGKTDGMITIWQIHDQQYYHLKNHENKIIFLQFIGNDELISAGWDDQIILWKFLEKNKEPQKSKKFNTKITDIIICDNTTLIVSTLKDVSNMAQNLSFGAFSNKGEVLVFRNIYGKLIFYDIKNDEFVYIFKKAHNQNATAVAFQKNDEYFAYGNGDGKITCLKKNGEEKLFDKHTKQITTLTFANKEKYLASGSVDMIVYVWNYEKKDTLLYTINELHKSINSIAFLIDDSLISIGGELRNILLYQLDSNENCLFLRGHISGINAVEFSPSGNTLVSASKDYCIKLWKLKKEKTAKPEKPDQPQKPDQNQKPDQTQKPDQNQKPDQPDKQIDVKKNKTNPSDENKKTRAIEFFQNKIFCYKTIGLNYAFEANDVTLDGATIKNNDNESLINNFKQRN